MTFGFFSGRGRSTRLVSKIVISIGFFLVCHTGDAGETSPHVEDGPASGSDDPAGDEDDAFFEGLSDIEDEGYESVVAGRRILATDETSGFAESIDVSGAAEQFTTAAEVLSRAGGVQVRRTGGVGSSASLGIRGSTSRQVPILLDGIEIGGGGTAAVDLGDLSLDLMESVEVYRGAAPVSLGQSGIGGAVCLRTLPLNEPFTRISGSLGSFGTERLSVWHAAPMGSVNGLATLSTLHTNGDFPYLNRNGTPHATAQNDDRIERRTNNHHTVYGALLKLGGPLKTWQWTLTDVLFAKQGGAPGLENYQTKTASAFRLRNQIFGWLSGPLGKQVQAALTTGYARMTDEFKDPQNDFHSLLQFHGAKTQTVPAVGLFQVTWKEAGVTDFSLDNRFEHLRREEHEHGGAPANSMPDVLHNRFALGTAHRWQPVEMLSLDPSIRMIVDHSTAAGSTGTSLTDNYWSPALGLKLTPLSWLALRASVGRFVRTPDLDELYGAGGAIEGNPSLKAETAVNGDAGVTATYTTKRGLLLSAEAAWFSSFAKDLIAYERKSFYKIRPENIGKAVIQGAETGLRISAVEVFSLQANYTYLYAINRSDIVYNFGKRLPGRPVHRVYGKFEVGSDAKPVGSRLWLDADFTGETFLKQSNQAESAIPARLFLGVGYRLSHSASGTSITLEVHNLLNQMTAQTQDGLTAPVSDFTGFPLPGREIFITVAWKG